MEEKPKLHVTQHAILTESDGVWTGRYAGEDWSVTADSKEIVLARLVEKFTEILDAPGRHGRIIEMAERAASGERVEDGFEAEYIGTGAYDDRMIGLMEAEFDRD